MRLTVNLLKGRGLDLCWGSVHAQVFIFQWGHGPGEEAHWSGILKNTEYPSGACFTFCKIHMVAREQNYYCFTLSLFTTKPKSICCVSLLSRATDISSLRHFSSWAVLQHYPSTAPFLKPFDDLLNHLLELSAFCCSITGNMQRIGSQVSVKPNKCRWRKKTWGADQQRRQSWQINSKGVKTRHMAGYQHQQPEPAFG